MNKQKLLKLLSQLDTTTDVFLPTPSHISALREQVLVVTGDSHSENTSLANFMLEGNPELLESFLKQIGVSRKYKLIDGGINKPINNWLSRKTELRMFWVGHLACSIFQSSKETLPPLGKVHQLREGEPEAFVSIVEWFSTVHQILGDSSIIVVYRHLNKIGSGNPAAQKRLYKPLIDLWMSLVKLFPRFRSKIFINDNVFQAILSEMPKSDILNVCSYKINWTHESAFKLLIRYIAQLSEETRGWLEQTIPLKEYKHLGWMPPEHLPETGLVSQKSLIDSLAPKYMGSGCTKCYTYEWIRNHLQDGRGRIVPSSLINLIWRAAENALQRLDVGNTLLTEEDLIAANELRRKYVLL